MDSSGPAARELQLKLIRCRFRRARLLGQQANRFAPVDRRRARAIRKLVAQIQSADLIQFDFSAHTLTFAARSSDSPRHATTRTSLSSIIVVVVAADSEHLSPEAIENSKPIDR